MNVFRGLCYTMAKIAIVTDSNSGITQAECKEFGIHVLPMPFYIDDKMYYEGVDLSQEEFYEKLYDMEKYHFISDMDLYYPDVEIIEDSPFIGMNYLKVQRIIERK